MRIQLSDHFTYSKLLRFTAPSIIMMIFTESLSPTLWVRPPLPPLTWSTLC